MNRPAADAAAPARPGLAPPGSATPRRVDAALAARIDERAGALEALYRDIAATRMADIPILHPGLRVAAVGFEADDDGAGAHGVLVTPWFMNLVWFPVEARDAGDAPTAGSQPAPSPAGWPTLALGATRERSIGNTRFPFIGAGEEPFGPFEACSLFSPMFEFEDQPAALATALAVLQALRQPAAAPEAPDAVLPRDAKAPEAPARRGFLFGSGRGASDRAGASQG